MEFKRKQKEEQQKLKELQAKASGKGPLGGFFNFVFMLVYGRRPVLMYLWTTLQPTRSLPQFSVSGGIKKSGKK